MTNYNVVNATWPDECPAPSGQEAISGVKRLIRHAFALAKAEGCPEAWCDYGRYVKQRKFKLTSGNRYTWPSGRTGTWRVNPERGFGLEGSQWKQIVHFVSHWAHRRFWPKDKPHSVRHAWLERELTTYAVANFLAGQLKRPESVKPAVPVKHIRATRVAARIKTWEAKRRRADNALRKLRRQARYYGLEITSH